MGVIVGKPDRQTPVLFNELTDVVFNPNWYVPPSIAHNDILPKLKTNPGFLKDFNISVYQTQDGVTFDIDPSTIDWENAENAVPSLQFRQSPGPENFLGRFKFILSNHLDIYLHDTSFKGLFSASLRDLSSGCVRLEKPKFLADYLLQEKVDWNGDKSSAILASGAPRRFTLSQPFPVYMLYWTAWVDAEGTVHFPPDIYELDGAVYEALSR